MEKTAVNKNVPIFSNSFVTCYADYMVIHLYYFPFGNKKIKYSNIRSCDFRRTDDIDIFSFKLWGMALSPIWWHCDMGRLGRKHYILLDANQWPLIGITMDDNDIVTVCNIIRQKMFPNQSNTLDEKPLHNCTENISEKEREHRESLQYNKNN